MFSSRLSRNFDFAFPARKDYTLDCTTRNPKYIYFNVKRPGMCGGALTGPESRDSAFFKEISLYKLRNPER
jgi:hypothetical protein